LAGSAGAFRAVQSLRSPAAVHDVKAAIRQVDLAACRKLASAALELASPREVRDLVSASKK
jgi:phosphoenolpyruvate-protein kinase (PTS system EI component)